MFQKIAIKTNCFFINKQKLASAESIEEAWPEELLQLKSRFAEKYLTEISEMRRFHDEEIARLKEEHTKSLNGALERARRRSLKDADSLNRGELELLRERDALRKQASSLRKLLGELVKYFTQCEDELNSTLVEELLSKNFSRFEDDSVTSLGGGDDVKRVHLTPNFDDLINFIDNSTENELDSVDLNLSSCLEKLKADANAILALTSNFRNEDDGKIKNPVRRTSSLDREVTSLTRKLINETQIKNELKEQLTDAKCIIQSLENERGALECQLEQLLDRQKNVESDLFKAREKIAELIENGHNEIVSEGYGEEGHQTVKGMGECALIFYFDPQKYTF